MGGCDLWATSTLLLHPLLRLENLCNRGVVLLELSRGLAVIKVDEHVCQAGTKLGVGILELLLAVVGGGVRVLLLRLLLLLLLLVLLLVLLILVGVLACRVV